MTPFELLKTACHAACRQTPACAPSYRAMLKTENISQMMAVWREYWEDISGGKYADIINDRPEVKAARDAAAKHKAEADALIKYIIRKDKPSTKARAKGLAERIAQLRKDYADIVTEDELKGYEAILEKVKSEIPKKPAKDEKQN